MYFKNLKERLHAKKFKCLIFELLCFTDQAYIFQPDFLKNWKALNWNTYAL